MYIYVFKRFFVSTALRLSPNCHGEKLQRLRYLATCSLCHWQWLFLLELELDEIKYPRIPDMALQYCEFSKTILPAL